VSLNRFAFEPSSGAEAFIINEWSPPELVTSSSSFLRFRLLLAPGLLFSPTPLAKLKPLFPEEPGLLLFGDESLADDMGTPHGIPIGLNSEEDTVDGVRTDDGRVAGSDMGSDAGAVVGMEEPWAPGL
jgi:hypothetical protein